MYKLKTPKFFCVRPLLYPLFPAIRTPIADNAALTLSQLELYFTRKILQCWLKLILCHNTGMEVTFSSETAKLLEEENIIIGAIYSRIAHLTINLQQGKYTFATLQTSPTNDSLWRLSHSFVDMDQQLDRDSYFLVHSRWNLRSTLLVLPPGFTIKTKHKEISKGSYNTSGEPPWKPDAHLYHSSTDITAHRRGDHLLRDGTSSSSSSHQSKNRELFRIRSFEEVGGRILPDLQSTWKKGFRKLTTTLESCGDNYRKRKYIN